MELNESMENWKKKYENLEEEKRALFEEMMEQNSKEKTPWKMTRKTCETIFNN